MIETVRLLEDGMQKRLSSFIGHELIAYEAYIMFEDPDQVYKSIRLEFDNGSLLMQNVHEAIPIGPEGNPEELAVLTLLKDDGRELWHPAGKHTTRKSGIDLLPNDIYLVVDTVNLTKGDIPVNKLKQVQAIVFREGGRLIAFDRDIWFDEYLNIREGADIDTLVRDTSADWSEEPPFDYVFTRDIVSLAMGGKIV